MSRSIKASDSESGSGFRAVSEPAKVKIKTSSDEAARIRMDTYKRLLESTRNASVDKTAILSRIQASQSTFESVLAQILNEQKADTYRFMLVDKVNALPASHVPADLESLEGTGLALSRKGLQLRKPALDALLRMNAAARTHGISLIVSSTYRSYTYQSDVFARNVKEMGETEAVRVSAKPGHSQHQLGTAIDFGSIDNSFAKTKAGVWLAENAAKFGFSLSYPRGLEPVTGYLWESWHYRFVGTSALELEHGYFGDIQQYLLEFLHVFIQSGDAGKLFPPGYSP